ncbi:MAG TPA: YdcF family protein [Gaiellaceae bacterium]
MFPREDSLRPADAVVVLAGSPGDRLPEGLRLVRGGIAPVLYISDGEHETTHGFCGHTRPYRVVCLRPTPYSTRGEAETVKRVAAARGWRRIVVVTSQYHVRRARMLFDRCLGSSRVAVVGTRPSLPRFALGALLEWPKLALALTLRRAC